MKKVFVRTDNVKRFIVMMNNLQNRADGVPGMGLVYGEPGLGKTQTINWWTLKNNALLIRCTQLMTPKWLLTEILEEMDEIRPTKTCDCFNLVIKNLIINPQILVIDEIDYLAAETRAVETLRDIHDKTNVPVILVGMTNANSRLRRYRHLYDRISEIVKFEPFTLKDIKQIINELSEIPINDLGMQFLYANTRRFRQIVKIINKAESFAKSNGISTIDEIILKEVLKNEAGNNASSEEA